MGNFKFGDHSTKDFDLVIQAPPTYTFPEKDVSVEHIPGRNGDLIIDNNCWKNTNRTYSIASVFRPGTDFIGNCERLVKWLTSYTGYHRLEDSYDPDVYRMAEFTGSGSLTNYYDRATALNVNFYCKPQRYLKSGENSVKFSGPVATLENITGYPALPEINISGISDQADDELLLVTVKNLEENKVTSVITLNKIISDAESYDVVLNSELQTVYSIQNGDINAYVNLNDTEFPTLYKGKTSISIDTYLENNAVIESYNSLIDRTIVNNNVCLAKYKPFDSVVESKQKQIYIMSFDLLKQKVQEVYEMKAYANYCLEKAEEYSFISFNTLLSNYAESFSFQEDFGSYPKEWLRIINDNGQIKIYLSSNLNGATINGKEYNSSYAYIMTTNAGSDSDKKIMKFSAGDLISDKVKNSSTVTINFYPATSDGYLDVDYSEYNMPDWLAFEIEYEMNQSNIIALKKIIFKHNKTGYFYLPKSGMFGKAYWDYYTSSGELNSMTWSSSKKAFMPSGISTSTTVGYQYYFIPKPYKTHEDPETHQIIVDQEFIQYEPVYENVLNEDGSVKKDANGNPVQKISNEVHFTVIPLNNDLSLVQIKAKDAGYFRLNDDNQGDGWKTVSIGGTVASNIKSNSSQLIYYLKDIPTYESIEEWPEWLDPVPMDSNNQPIIIINPETIDFRVKESAWYMYTYVTDDGDRNTCWFYRNAGELLGIIDPNTDTIYPEDSEGYSEYRTNEDNCTVYMLEGDSSEFPVKKYVYTDTKEYDSTKTYKKGDYCIVTGESGYMECIEDINEPEQFDPNKWENKETDGHAIDNIAMIYVDSDGKEHDYPNNQPPSWLKVSVNIGVEADGSDTMLDFYPQQQGLYKWDTKNTWETKHPSDTDVLVSSKTTDDTSVYFMDSIPEYDTSGLIFDYCNVEINTNKITGNPESISVYAKIEGYYRAKNNSSWKYYNIGDEICNSKVSESTDIHYLTETNDTLDNIEISIIPRWWSL